MGQKLSVELSHELEEAKKLVRIGGLYFHYKSPDKLYSIVALGFFESTEEICVVYKALYENGFTWIRTLTNFFELVETPQGTVSRFSEINNSR